MIGKMAILASLLSVGCVAAPVASASAPPPTPSATALAYVPKPVPTPGPTADVRKGQAARSLTNEEWQAIFSAYPEAPLLLSRIGVCESDLDPNSHIIDVDGIARDGAFNVGYWFGPVPAGLPAQAMQAADILRKNGSWPFTTAGGCPRWTK